MSMILALEGCRDRGATPVDPTTLTDSGDIWPLTPGNDWLYKIDQPTWVQDTVKMEITGSILVSFQGENYTAMKMTVHSITQSRPEFQWLYWNGPDGVYSMGGISPTDTFIVKELQLKYPVSVGDTWRCQSVAYSSDRGKFYINDTLKYSLIAKDVSVITPSGTFKCFQYQFSKRPADDIVAIWDYNFYYTPGIGQIAEESISHTDHTTKDKYVLITHQLVVVHTSPIKVNNSHGD